MEKNRLNDFKDAVNSLNVKSGAPDRDKLYQRLGAIFMVSGIVLDALNVLWVDGEGEREKESR